MKRRRKSRDKGKIVEWEIYCDGRYIGKTWAPNADTAVRNHPLHAVRKLVARPVRHGEIIGLPKRARDFLVRPPGGKPLRSYVDAVTRANNYRREHGAPATVYDDRSGRPVYVARDAMLGSGRPISPLQALREIDAGWAHSLAKGEVPRAVADALVERGWARLVDTRKGWRWAVTSAGSWALGTFERSRTRPRRRRRRRS